VQQGTLNADGYRIMGGWRETEFRHKVGHDRDGEWTEERQQFHKERIATNVAGHATQDRPRALFTAGGAASGKSWITKNLAPEDSVLVDPDEEKKIIPEYQPLLDSGNSHMAAGAVHEESSALAKKTAQVALELRQNVVIDGVGDSGPDKFAGKIQAAIDAGHEVDVAYMTTTVKQALKNEEERSKRTGRKVKKAALLEGHQLSSARFHEVVHLNVGVSVYDSTDGIPPKLIARGRGGALGIAGLEILDKAAFESFLGKASA
jgi:hypothetical protein